MPAVRRKIPVETVLIGETADWSGEGVDVFDPHLEEVGRDSISQIRASLERVTQGVTYYASPKAFMRNIGKHEDAFVVAPWCGASSASRVCFVPAICEAAGIRYLGSDAYTRALCNDKHIAKVFARRAGFLVADGLRIDEGGPTDLVDRMTYPVFVKPCLEGTSIGIDPDAVCRSPQQARARIERVIGAGYAPVLVENFIRGREVSISMLGNRSGVKHAVCLEQQLAEDPDYFLDRPYDPTIKKGKFGTRVMSIVDARRVSGAIEASKVAFSRFERAHILRVDGRLTDDDEFVFLEFTTFPTISPTSELFHSFQETTTDHAEFIRLIVLTALEDYRSSDTNAPA